MMPDPIFLNIHMYGIMIAIGVLCAFASSCSWPFAHMFLLALSPDSVDNRITVFE